MVWILLLSFMLFTSCHRSPSCWSSLPWHSSWEEVLPRLAHVCHTNWKWEYMYILFDEDIMFCQMKLFEKVPLLIFVFPLPFFGLIFLSLSSFLSCFLFLYFPYYLLPFFFLLLLLLPAFTSILLFLSLSFFFFLLTINWIHYFIKELPTSSIYVQIAWVLQVQWTLIIKNTD